MRASATMDKDSFTSSFSSYDDLTNLESENGTQITEEKGAVVPPCTAHYAKSGNQSLSPAAPFLKRKLPAVRPGRLYLRRQFPTEEEDVEFRLEDFSIVIRRTKMESRERVVTGKFGIQVLEEEEGGGGKVPQLASLAISHEHCDAPLWSSKPGVSFVGAAAASLHVNENIPSGPHSTRLQDQHSRHYNIQTIDAIERGPVNVLTISGRLAHQLSDGRFPADSPAYQLQLTAHKHHDGKVLHFRLQASGGQPGFAITQTHLFLESWAHEAIYGLGQRYSRCNAKGLEIDLLNSSIASDAGFAAADADSGAGNALGSGCNAPHFVSSNGRSFCLSNYEPCVFDLRMSDWITVRMHCSHMRGALLAGRDALDAVRIYTGMVGRTRPLPGWTQRGGLILGARGGSKQVRDLWNRLKRHRCPIGGILVRDWTGANKSSRKWQSMDGGVDVCWNWVLEREHYIHWHALVNDLETEGISLGVYLNPHIESIPPHLRSGRRYLFQEATENDYFVKTLVTTAGIRSHEVPYNAFSNIVNNNDVQTNHEPQFNVIEPPKAGLLDLTNHRAYAWFKQQVLQKEVLKYAGASFWMADMADSSSPILRTSFHDRTENGLSYHNEYADVWARLNREAIKEAGRDGDAFFITRAGYTHTPKHVGCTCLGDYDTHHRRNRAGLANVLKALLNGGFSGFVYAHCAISMSNSSSLAHKVISKSIDSKSREMTLRWMEMMAFTTLFRTHDHYENSEDHTRFYSDKVVLDALTRWSTVFCKLANYRLRLFNEASFRGYPVVRHPALHFPQDVTLMDSNNAFMLGDSLFVAPVLKAGVTKSKVYLPMGQWIHLWSGQYVTKLDNDGTTIEIPSPLNEPPVFYRNCEEMNRFVTELKQVRIVQRSRRSSSSTSEKKPSSSKRGSKK